jgi:hypothetical protein
LDFGSGRKFNRYFIAKCDNARSRAEIRQSAARRRATGIVLRPARKRSTGCKNVMAFG